MGSFLVGQFRSEVNKLKDERMKAEASFDVGYSTGFASLDFLNGAVVHVKSDKMDFTYNSIGLVDGSANTFIGRSGCGKTTILLQIAGNIIRPFENSAIYFDCLEGGISSSGFETLLKMPSEEYEDKLIYRNTGITAENFYQRIKMIHDIKISNMDKFEYDTGLYDTRGNRIFKLQPTVYIMDSIAMLVPDKIADEEELGGQMSATSIAKSNTAIFKRIIPLLKMANIILLVVNHILDDVQTGLFPNKPQIAGLKPGERLPGGKAAIYLANNMFRMDDNKKLKEEEGLGIDGAIVDIMVVKSRTNKSLRAVPLVLNFATGFDNELSLFLLLKQCGRITGAGAYYKLDGWEEKFTQKNFKEKLRESPEMQQQFAKVSYEVLSQYLSDRSDSTAAEQTFNLNSMIMQNSKVA